MKEKRARLGLGWPSGRATQGSRLPGGLHVTLTHRSASQLTLRPPLPDSSSYPPQSITVWGQGSGKEGESTCSSLSWNLTHSQWKALSLPLCPIKLPSFMLCVSAACPAVPCVNAHGNVTHLPHQRAVSTLRAPDLLHGAPLCTPGLSTGGRAGLDHCPRPPS